jgi:hypothetical protein
VVFIRSLLSTIKIVANDGMLLILITKLESNFSFELNKLFGVTLFFGLA